MTSRWIRRVALGLAATLLLLAAAATALVLGFDADRHKTQLIDWVQTTYQRRLAIDGPLAVTLLPRLALQVEGLSLSERGRADEFVAVTRASLALQWLPLLRGQLVIDRISASGVRAAYLRSADGRRNIDDLLPREQGAEATSSNKTGAALRWDISAVQLDGLRLRLQDEPQGLEGELLLQQLSTGRLGPLAESPLRLRAALQLSRPRALQLALDGGLTLKLSDDLRRFDFKDIALTLAGDTAGVQALKIALAGAATWDGSVLSAAALRLSLSQATLGSTQLGASSLSLAQLRFTPASQRLELGGLQLALAGQQGGGPLSLALDWPTFRLDGQQLTSSAWNGQLALAGPQSLKATLRAPASQGSLAAWRLPGLAITLAAGWPGELGPRSADGDIQLDLLLQASGASLAIERLKAQATLRDPGLAPLQLSLSGQLAADAHSARWALQGAIDGSGFDSEGQLKLSGPVPELQASAGFGRLDLNRLLAAAPPQPVPAGDPMPRPPPIKPQTKPQTKPPTDPPVDLAGLRALNGNFSLQAEALTWRQFKLTQARLAASLRDGRLQVSQLAGQAWGGRLAGSGSADAAQGQLGLKLEASGVNVQALLQDVAGRDMLEGTGRVVADLRSSGASLSALRAGLAGTAAVQLRDGAVKGFNLAKSLRQAKAALTQRQDAVAQASQTEKTDFSTLNISARIVQGVAKSDDLELRSPFLRVGGDGQMDIGQGQIDYTARATVVANAAGQGGGALDALRGVSVPVKLSGPLSDVGWQIRWSEVAATALQDRLKDRLGERLSQALGVQPDKAGEQATPAPARPEDLLKDKLKRLLR